MWDTEVGEAARDSDAQNLRTVALCTAYLDDDDRRQRIRRNGRDAILGGIRGGDTEAMTTAAPLKKPAAIHTSKSRLLIKANHLPLLLIFNRIAGSRVAIDHREMRRSAAAIRLNFS